eukprot:Selendium_serpulae@DN6389_c2_g6_i1.p1
MAFTYKFSNLCGAPYKGGNASFSPDGDVLLVPVSNRVAALDLINNRSLTLPFESNLDVAHVALSPDGSILLTIDSQGAGLVVNAVKGVILNRIHFRGRVGAVEWSRCGRFLAVGVEKVLWLWEAPTAAMGWQLSKLREIHGHLAPIRCISWSSNSRFILTSSKDSTVRLVSRHNDIATMGPIGSAEAATKIPGTGTPIGKGYRDGASGLEIPSDGRSDEVAELIENNFVPSFFVDHRYGVRGAYFTADGLRVVSASEDGVLLVWRWASSEDLSRDGLSVQESDVTRVLRNDVKRRATDLSLREQSSHNFLPRPSPQT